MKKSKFSESQVVNILKEVQAEVSVEALSRRQMISRRFALLQRVGWKTTTPFVRMRHYKMFRPASLHDNMPRFVYL